MKIDNNLLLNSSPYTGDATDLKTGQNFKSTLAKAAMSEDDKKLYAACQEFESVFASQVLEAMRSTIPRSDLISRSFADDAYESMLYDEYAKGISKTGTLGITDLLFRQLSQKPVTTSNK